MMGRSGSESGSAPLTHGSGSKRPKKLRILRMYNNKKNVHPTAKHWMQEMCSLMIMFKNCSMTIDRITKKIMFCHIGFHMNGKIVMQPLQTPLLLLVLCNNVIAPEEPRRLELKPVPSLTGETDRKKGVAENYLFVRRRLFGLVQRLSPG